MSKTNNDVVIKQLLEKVEKQKADLGTKERNVWLTNGVFKFDASNCVNINTVSDGSVLASALALLIEKETAFKDACRRLGVKAEFKWNGYSMDEWEEDFKTRIKAITWSEKKKVLDSTKTKLNQLVSEEARTEMELDSIKALLEN